ncbi:DEAD/DEAH box helicase [Sulfuriroseicoccus oceanibius]|uniref:DEAD/DEAH box helicase n=1 Tax=Sulfuriroseicoccus oceanibius TaxID=2707525 RepID=A0A6B3L7Y8_9BACT|nr:DEAD/DEAH box helicase [Sulfuriroseicoccus oceanibius]QQL43856.1 DEAD/DEAH box helicase [Sulfuriroseicoccus oceanibius]
MDDPFANLSALEIPDIWQQDAVHALRSGHDVVVDAPTGAGKTKIFELLVEARDIQGQAVYTVPTRALANDKFTEWTRKGWNCGIATGDVAKNINAPVVVATLETLREQIIDGNGPALLVIDEYQMIANRVRGLNYELMIALAPQDTQLLLLSGSVANPQHITAWMERIGRSPKLVRVSERPVPLDEQPVELLPRFAPKSITGLLPKLAVGVCMSDMAPLLIFAPHRRNAEKIARQIASALPEDKPLNVPQHGRKDCPAELVSLLGKRVAYHHSGLPYPVRAGLIEPLAKAGQLRVIVATTGLAAGINFSVRSVFVTARSYREGPYIRHIAPDELLQMFGRAGRRGLDEQGYVITTRDSPKPADGHAEALRRTNVVDWPTLLRIMDREAAHGGSPFAAATELCARLFSEQTIRLGFEESDTEETHAPSEEKSPYATAPKRREILASSGEWDAIEDEPELTPLARCLSKTKRGWKPSLQLSAVVDAHFALGVIKRLESKSSSTGWRYVKHVVLATSSGDQDHPDGFRATKAVRKFAKLNQRLLGTHADGPQLAKQLAKQVARTTPGLQLHDLIVQPTTITGIFDLANIRVEAIHDSHGKALLDPPQRVRELDSVTDFIDPETGDVRTAPANSPLRAWRRLALIDHHGVPTRRGVVFSFFQRGEGLAIAAALEESDYLCSELVWHLANLRAGHRFTDVASEGADRLGAVCRKHYGALNYPGYLELGLPPGFGEGAADCLMAWLLDGRRPDFNQLDQLGPGDLERARIEWLSLMRHIHHAPDYDWERWRELQHCAADILERFGDDSRLNLAPALPHDLQRPANLKLVRV